VDGRSVGSGMSVNTTELEGNRAVAIKQNSVWLNSSVNVAPSESVTYTAHFASDTSVPYIAQAEGTAGEIRLMPPAIEDTTDDAGPNRWNAAIKAMKSFNSTIASSGGRATIAVEIPTLSRDIGTVELNDTVTVLVHNASGWFAVPPSGYSLEGGVLTLFNIDTADVDQVSIGFEGRRLGDVSGEGDVDLMDAVMVARADIGLIDLTDQEKFYGDVTNVSEVTLDAAVKIARFDVGLTDDYFSDR